MDFVNFLPASRPRPAIATRPSTACRRGTINITLDGVNVQDNTLRSTDGFFAIVSPRLDAIEEVTVTTATQGADPGKARCRSSSSRVPGRTSSTAAATSTTATTSLNANTWFNNRAGTAKAEAAAEPGGRARGRPHRDSRALRRPQQGVLLRQLRGGPAAERHDAQPDHPEPGGEGGQLQVRRGDARSTCWSWRRANGQIATPDPTIGSILRTSAPRSTAGRSKTIDANLERFRFNVPVEIDAPLPDVPARLQRHR